ncbi:MAG: TerB N-terminal domain-containing protein [Deltaproteobacteria bacterium]|nr:TerB N-terminal domain-containing protein [Deltaproteobacteria bacterium]
MTGLLVLAAWAFLAWLIVKALRNGFIGRKEKTPAGPEPDDDILIRVSAGSGGDTYRIPPEPGISEECWMSPGREVTVQGYSIPGGMIYVGERLTSLNGHMIEPALINPALPVDDRVSDPEGSSFGYWPSYSRIPPHARATYLGWLARGRKDPYIGIGYVFLFFYGVERRCLADAGKSEHAGGEREALGKEVERLLSIYGNHHAFRRYASSFLDYLDLSSAAGEKPVARQPPSMQTFREMPARLKFGLARMAAERIPVPAEWALTWVLSHQETKLRTPAKRCEGEFRALFKIRYEERFGEGMMLESTGPPLTLTYKPASASFGREVAASTPFCDVSTAKAPIRPLAELVTSCQEELDGYSRLLGREPDAGGGLPALALLPTPLLSRADMEESSEFRGWLDEQLGGKDLIAADAREFVRRWPVRQADRMLKREHVLLVQLLEKWRLGLEPDPRFAGPCLRAKGRVMLFRVGDNGSHAPSEEYLSARMLLHLAVLAFGPAGGASEDDMRSLEGFLSRSLGLTSGEEIRLWAHYKWLLDDPSVFGRISKRVETLPEPDRLRIGRALDSLASSDGGVRPSEVCVLTRIYHVLGLDPGKFRIRTDAPAHPIVPCEGMADLRTAEIPAVQREETNGILLDMHRLRMIREDTAKVSALLADVFCEEEDVVTPVASQEQLVAGLDLAHSALLKALADKESWPREEFEDLAARWGLLPEGALEILNEAAWDSVGEALCGDEDPIRLDRTVLEEMFT